MDRNLDLQALGTLPRMLARNAAEWPDQIAMREKDLGIWKALTWRECLEQVKLLTYGLHAMGIGADDVVGLIGQNRPHWVFSQIAAHAAHALSLGIYKDSLADEVAYLINFAEIKLVLAEDEEQVDKLLELGDTIPSVKKIVYFDARGMRKYDDPRLISIDALHREARTLQEREPGLFDALVAARSPEATAILCTTSGTTSRPKLAMISGHSFLRHCASFLLADPKYPGDEYVSVLPLPWIGEQVYAVAHFLLSGITVNFVEEDETTSHDMREIGPTCLLYPPRVWEAISADVKARMMDAGPFKRAMFHVGMKLGLRAVDKGGRSRLTDLLIGRALRDRLGFSRLRSAATGGAPLGPDVFRFFRAFGVPLRQLYGQTEMTGVYAGHTHDDVDYDTVGVPFENVEIRIDNADRNGIGEVMSRHPGMFSGYYRNDEATRETIRDGWMYTADAGYINKNGHLVVLDRVNDLAVMANGDRFSPQYLENKLKFSPYIGECVALGQNRDYIAAMICIRYSILSKWAEKRHVSFTTYSDLSGLPQVYDLIRAEVEATNATLPESQRIRRFLLLYKELDADDGELTRTRKVRRGTINERYGMLIDALYSGQDKVEVDTTITLQDGRKTRIQQTLRIVSMHEAAPANPHNKESVTP
ncbi:MAG: AMP-dependent synthetase and ligase [Herminiimonas sp.]|nr:AMP-dependent synthetase and ligase [Herminiimonas sp.]